MNNSDRYGMTCGASWLADPATGHLSAAPQPAGTVSRPIVEVSAPTLLDFEMAIRDGDEADRLRSFISGVQVAETGGEPVHVRQNLGPAQAVTLMWEFHCGTGTATIGDFEAAIRDYKTEPKEVYSATMFEGHVLYLQPSTCPIQV